MSALHILPQILSASIEFPADYITVLKPKWGILVTSPLSNEKNPRIDGTAWRNVLRKVMKMSHGLFAAQTYLSQIND